MARDIVLALMHVIEHEIREKENPVKVAKDIIQMLRKTTIDSLPPLIHRRPGQPGYGAYVRALRLRGLDRYGRKLGPGGRPRYRGG